MAEDKSNSLDISLAMDNLEQVYEAAEILKELKLPVSIELLEKIERLEDEKGIEHREDFRNYMKS